MTKICTTSPVPPAAPAWNPGDECDCDVTDICLYSWSCAWNCSTQEWGLVTEDVGQRLCNPACDETDWAFVSYDGSFCYYTKFTCGANCSELVDCAEPVAPDAPDFTPTRSECHCVPTLPPSGKVCRYSYNCYWDCATNSYSIISEIPQVRTCVEDCVSDTAWRFSSKIGTKCFYDFDVCSEWDCNEEVECANLQPAPPPDFLPHGGYAPPFSECGCGSGCMYAWTCNWDCEFSEWQSVTAHPELADCAAVCADSGDWGYYDMLTPTICRFIFWRCGEVCWENADCNGGGMPSAPVAPDWTPTYEQCACMPAPTSTPTPTPTPSPTPCPPQGCPPSNGCAGCKETYSVLVSGLTGLCGGYGPPCDCTKIVGATLTRTYASPFCGWTVYVPGQCGDWGTTYTLYCSNDKWWLTINNEQCALFSANNCNGCPPSTGWTRFAVGGCTGGSVSLS